MVSKKKSLIADETREEKDKKKKDHASVSRKYYTIPEEALQRIITKAKSGNINAQEQLFEVFDNFLKKYVALLYDKRYDLRDYDIRRYIALFATGGHSKKIQRNQIDPVVYQHINEVMRGLNYMVQRYCTREDVEQTIKLTFTQCVSRYERRGEVPFSGFLYNYFFYRLKKNTEEFLISPIGRKTFGLYTEDGVSSSNNPTHNVDMGQVNSEVQRQIQIDEKEIYTLGADIIDEFWVSSETASYPFTKLTINQRQLLKWRYIDGLKAPKIAEKTSEHPNTCRAQLHKIREDLEDILGAQLSDYVDFDLSDIADD